MYYLHETPTCIHEARQGFPFGFFWGRPPHAPPPAPPAHVFDGGARGGLIPMTWGGMGGPWSPNMGGHGGASDNSILNSILTIIGLGNQ